ncbi:hypothetical protein D3C81_1021070 [compost metagenome]
MQVQALARFDFGQDRHIGMLAEQRRQGFLGVAQAQVDGDARVSRTQLRQHRHDPVRAVSGHFQTPGEQLPVGLKHHLRFFDQTEHGAGDGRQAYALLGQFYPPGGAAQQGDLVMLLQRLDMPGHRRLADEQAVGGAGKAALTGHCIEGAELEQVHIYRPDLWLA